MSNDSTNEASCYFLTQAQTFTWYKILLWNMSGFKVILLLKFWMTRYSQRIKFYSSQHVNILVQILAFWRLQLARLRLVDGLINSFFPIREQFGTPLFVLESFNSRQSCDLHLTDSETMSMTLRSSFRFLLEWQCIFILIRYVWFKI